MLQTTYQQSPDFQSAAQYVSSSPDLKKLSNDTKLKLYTLFKLVTTSRQPPPPRPGMLSFEARAKWDAWEKAGKDHEGRSTQEIEQEYLDLCTSLGWKADAPVSVTAPEASGEEESGGGGGGMAAVSKIQRDEEEHEAEDSLHGAVVKNDSSLISKLLENPDVNVDAIDKYGYTPLHLAADRGYLPIVRLLLKKGANIGVKDGDDQTAISLAKIAGHSDIVQMLEEWLMNKGYEGQDV